MWNLLHAHKIYAIMQKVFVDMDGTDQVDVTDEFSSHEEDDSLPEDCNAPGLDDELAKMALDELTLCEVGDSQFESIESS